LYHLPIGSRVINNLDDLITFLNQQGSSNYKNAGANKKSIRNIFWVNNNKPPDYINGNVITFKEIKGSNWSFYDLCITPNSIWIPSRLYGLLAHYLDHPQYFPYFNKWRSYPTSNITFLCEIDGVSVIKFPVESNIDKLLRYIDNKNVLCCDIVNKYEAVFIGYFLQEYNLNCGYNYHLIEVSYPKMYRAVLRVYIY